MQKPSVFDDFLRSDSYSAWKGEAQRDFAPDECQAYAMGLVRDAIAAGLFYTSEVFAYCVKAAEVPPGVLAIDSGGSGSVEYGHARMHFYHAREAVDRMDAWAREERDAVTVRAMIGAKPRCIMWDDYKRTAGAVVLGEDSPLLFRVRGNRGRCTFDWTASASTIVAAIDRYDSRMAMRGAA